MRNPLATGLSLLLLALPAIALAQLFEGCDFEAERDATVDAAGAELLEIQARAGALVVEGRQDLAEVRIRGRACASSQELLDGIELRADRRGSSVRVEAVTPEEEMTRGRYSLLDLTLEVPAGLRAEIEDSSGSTEIRGIAALRLRDGSGSIVVEGIAGPVAIVDGSGSLRVERVRGDVEIDDGSGGMSLSEIAGTVNVTDGSGSVDLRGIVGSVTLSDGSGSVDLSGITGSVTLSDGSGSIAATNVTGNLTVRRDGSGSISAVNVAGDFVVERDGSGSVAYTNVGGTVRIPGGRDAGAR